jgi:hypothetical protein
MNNVTIVGNLADDPELRYTPQGLALLVLCEGGIPRAIDPEAAAQGVGVGEDSEKILK